MTEELPDSVLVLRAIGAYWQRHGDYPRRDCGPTDAYGLPGDTWAAVARRWPKMPVSQGLTLEQYGRLYLEGTPLKPRRRKRRR